MLLAGRFGVSLMLVASPSGQALVALQRDRDYQTRILPGVSRTFALTIPVLPRRLADVVGNAYLLCRIADTIEDDPDLANRQKTEFHDRFLSVVKGREDAGAFAADLAPRLSPQILDDERDLVRNTPKVIRITCSFSDGERAALTRCLTVMCTGMPKFQRTKSLRGLKSLGELGAYCYVVAGVVGEMLTDLFCIHCPELAKKRDDMLRLAVSFGQGLQMTNILKDVWDDRRSGTCWLPRSMFADPRFSLERMDELHGTQAFRDGLNALIGVTHRHLLNALTYTCHIPVREAGMRRFCLWAVGLAIMTLRKLHRTTHFAPGQQVKVSRGTVKVVILATNLMLSSNRCLRWLFGVVARGLPLWRVGKTW